ncbi:uncharacterized protein LOC120514821 isoform X2 [Polypterus senegalus]|uniref:uncharacterized protein LOC120514821 isoform X2 n=1 Tax=Polypterus senegalus TaxID=55291 RepID=UPI001963186A|nr:uncharacterized protein LOC120514821 isoform X2 [Polypterus senegalus]
MSRYNNQVKGISDEGVRLHGNSCMELLVVYYCLLFWIVAVICPEVPMASGSDLSVSCNHQSYQLYWFRQQHPGEVPVPLLHTYGPGDDSAFRYPGTSDRVSVTSEGTLVIRNASEEDENFYYYCAAKDQAGEILFRNVSKPKRKALPERCSCTLPVMVSIALGLLLLMLSHALIYTAYVLKSKDSKKQLERLFPNMDEAKQTRRKCGAQKAVSQVQCERSFSALKRIKSHLRSTMTQEHLKVFMLMLVEKSGHDIDI